MVPVWTAGLVVTIPIPAGTVWCRPLMKTSRCACTWYWRLSAVSGTRPAAVASSTTRSACGAGHRGARPDADVAGRWPGEAEAGIEPTARTTATSPITAHPLSAFCTLDLPGSRSPHCVLDRVGVELAAAAGAAEEVRPPLVL